MPAIFTSPLPSDLLARLPQEPVLIFPTETLYGIGCRVSSPQAIARVFQIKGRDLRQPPPVLIAERAQLETLVKSIPASAQELMEAYWPGSLTLILPAHESVADCLCGTSANGQRTIGVRHSAHPLAIELCRALDAPIIATSANFSGAIGRAAAPHCLDDIPNEFQNLVDAVIDGGGVKGLPSTVVDCTEDVPRILRSGAILLSQHQTNNH